jgi:hypothetical protein
MHRFTIASNNQLHTRHFMSRRFFNKWYKRLSDSFIPVFPVIVIIYSFISAGRFSFVEIAQINGNIARE